MALGEYRGPSSARAFMRYALARFEHADNEEVYRIYVTEYLRSITGGDSSYYDLVHGEGNEDFDAEQVIDDVISKMGLEGE